MMKNLLVILETWVLSLLWEDPLEMKMATHSGILTWRIPWTEEPGWLQSTDSQRVGHHWATNTFRVHLFPFLCGQSSELWHLMSRYSPVFMELLLHLVFWYLCDSSQDMAQNIVYSPWERTKGFWLCLETQFNSVPQSCLTLCDLMDCSRPSLPVHHQLPGLAQTHVHQVSDATSHLILCHCLLLPPSIIPSTRIFLNESALRIRWPEYSSFSFNISPSNEYSGLISFRMDWVDLRAF